METVSLFLQSEESGVVKLVLVDSNGSPANKVLVQAVYDHIVSRMTGVKDPSDRLCKADCRSC